MSGQCTKPGCNRLLAFKSDRCEQHQHRGNDLVATNPDATTSPANPQGGAEQELRQELAEIIYGPVQTRKNLKAGVYMPDVEAAITLFTKHTAAVANETRESERKLMLATMEAFSEMMFASLKELSAKGEKDPYTQGYDDCLREHGAVFKGEEK